MFAWRRFSQTAAAAAASSAIAAVGAHQAMRLEEEAPVMKRTKSAKKMTRTKSSMETEAILNSKLFESYKYHFGEKKQQLSRDDINELLLGCGILDSYIVDSTYTVMMNMAQAQKKKKGGDKVADADKVPYKVFHEVCRKLTTGSDEDKINFIFDFIDLDKSGVVDKNEISVVVRHLLFCRTNWFGEDVLYDGADDMDLFFDVPTECITQLKANKFAHELVNSAHGGARQMGLDKKMFKMWFNKGGKKVVEFKNLFSALGVFEDTLEAE